ncbi:MAG TPA: hypothetical protein VK797_22955 [Tepidisphaeraceae bacterium]|jgi:hypothetical protein|nr:hypothetical protein [Tepidisphaeraceae bacterium]
MNEPIEGFTVRQLIDIAKKEEHRTQWGEWKFDPSRLTLTHEGEGYEIDLELINSSAGILDWIMQINAKDWGDPPTIKNLLDAFDNLLHPQANYCSGGSHMRVNAAVVIRRNSQRLSR